ncbi:hypothetical protein D7V93_18005 [Corallococcus llansteffanensis]|uniref:Pesticidal crystal protein domain-containing protein n=2 Tax=Corallococcus llansteffanensis TaxID=2316731 RepID=A0A3A8Q3A0_9BACT|nr:hypothetical protein D7V93_18005 [Corallococcus llansteffanensis]
MTPRPSARRGARPTPSSSPALRSSRMRPARCSCCPQFAQFANLHLSLLRDGVLFGSSWGWTADYLQQQQQLLTQTLKDSVSYVDTTYQNSFTPLDPGILNSPLKPPIPAVAPPPYLGSMDMGQTLFLWTNTYVRQMTRMALDFATLWPYFDPSAYPPPVSIQLKSEIYSDPIGTAQGWNGLPSAPTQPMSQLTVWGASNIFAEQATYPQGAGPNGATTTPRLGNATAGSSPPPLGGTFDVAANPITTVSVLVSGGEPVACFFTFPGCIRTRRRVPHEGRGAASEPQGLTGRRPSPRPRASSPSPSPAPGRCA